MLTDVQLAHFQTFGFVVLRQLFTPKELEIIKREFIEELERVYHHAPFDGTKRYYAVMLGSTTPFFASLLEDPRFCGVAEQLYGEDTIGIATDANRYVGNTGWHPDTGSYEQFGVKFAFYLQPVGPDRGALRVIPGSCKQPYFGELREQMKTMNLAITDVPGHVCVSEPGDVVAFDLRTWHASYGGSNDRWMCTCVYYNNPKTPEQEEVTRRQAVANKNVTAHFGRPGDTWLPPEWIANPKKSPKRQRWLDRMRELEFFDA